ncbi:MAG: HAD hydrolase family protein [Cyclobacteriaceae bacterium]|nr:HAD hydrolase family protein [Cyclobacteriaceae bacterium]
MSDESYVELDELHDWQYVELLLEHKLKAPVIYSNASSIKLFLTDVDGVLTDAGMYYSETGDELKKFNTRNGKAFELLRNVGIKTGIITAQNTKIVERRARKIKSDYLYQGVKDKVIVLRDLIKTSGISPSEIAYIGDDLNDLGIIGLVGLSACPSDAVREVKEKVNIVLKSTGGEGAVREFAEWILPGGNEDQ